MANNNMHAAKKAKNDEFYTQLSDIENEVKHYKDQFRDKVVYLNCDDAEWSNFWLYFKLNFKHLGLKKLISTHYSDTAPSYKLVIDRALDLNGDGVVNEKDLQKITLKQNGDFRSDESIELLKEADIVVTNPPFSLFREYVAQLIQYNKEFIIIGSMIQCQTKDIFPLFMDDEVWFGINSVKEFVQPDGSIKKFGNICWFTNLNHKIRNSSIILYKNYINNEEDFPKYDGYDAIDVSKVKEIPIDYDGVMGVPVTFLNKYNPNQFEIIGKAGKFKIDEHNLTKPTINGKDKFTRILIKKK